MMLVSFLLMTFMAFAGEEKPSNLSQTLPTYFSALNNPSPKISCEEGAIENFCRDPYKTICSDMRTHRNTQLARTEALSPKDGSSYKSPRIQEAHNSFRIITDYMRTTLANSDLGATDKRDFDILIQRTKIMTSSEAVAEIDAVRPMPRESFEKKVTIERVCDYDFSNPLAMAFQSDESGNRTNDPVVVVCDGLLDSLPPGQDLTKRLFMVVAHELSHVFSAKWYPGSYTDLTNCLSEKEGPKLVEEYLQAAKRHEFPGEETKAPPVHRLVGAMMPEVSCDFWAKEAFKTFLSTRPSREDTLTHLRESYGYFCGVETSGSHPSGRFRIDMIGRDPAVRKYMGCEESSQNPVTLLNCSL